MTMNEPRRKMSVRGGDYWLLVWGVLVASLVFLDVSTATWSPHQPPTASNYNNLNTFQRKRYDNSQEWGGQASAHHRRSSHLHTRGGSAILQEPPPHFPQEQQQPQQQYADQTLPLVQQQHYSSSSNTISYEEETPPPSPTVPTISLKQMAKALLHTSEWNRKLLSGIKHWGMRHRRQPLLKSSSQGEKPTLPRGPDASSSFHHSQTSDPYLQNVNYQQESQYYNHQPQQQQNQQYYPQHGGSSAGYSMPVNVHPSRTWHPPIGESSGRDFEEEDLTLFHAKIPRKTSTIKEEDSDEDTPDQEATESETLSSQQLDTPDGWGPELLPYLTHIAEILEIPISKKDNDTVDTSNIELLLAMIYLDRACSVETPRTQSSVPACPFVQPRTVHRLGLAALVVAKQAVCGTTSSTNALVDKLSEKLGIPQLQLQQMVDWMIQALGDDGLYVGTNQLLGWTKSWDAFCQQQESES